MAPDVLCTMGQATVNKCQGLSKRTNSPSCVCHRKMRWEEAALPPAYSPPPLTSHHTWQPSVLKDYFGNWEPPLEGRWMTEHRFISQVFVCILVCILLNLEKCPGVAFPNLAVIG